MAETCEISFKGVEGKDSCTPTTGADLTTLVKIILRKIDDTNAKLEYLEKELQTISEGLL
ncbi:hypothetical protein [Vibrio cholerae]|uniref:hypothetical protein n=1 Tax=Vibrio cholerae TaxID=666 RepID=UPI003019E0BD